MLEIKVTGNNINELVNNLQEIIDRLPHQSAQPVITQQTTTPATLAPAEQSIQQAQTQQPVVPVAQPTTIQQQVPVQQDPMQQSVQQMPMQQPAVPVQQAPMQQLTQPSTPVQQPTTVPTTAPTYTMEQLAVAATQLIDTGRQQELINLLYQFGVQALTMLPKEQYGAFATKLREMGAKL